MLFGTVTGRIVATIADRLGDPDVNPDVVPVTGRVRFTPSVDAAISSTEGAIVLPTPIDADLDSEGYLSVNGERGVSLVATDSPDLNPTGFTYTVTFIDLKFDKFPLAYKSFSIALPAGSTVDLSTVTPVGSSNGAIIIRGAQGEPGPAGGSFTYDATAAQYTASGERSIPAIDPATNLLTPAVTAAYDQRTRDSVVSGTRALKARTAVRTPLRLEDTVLSAQNSASVVKNGTALSATAPGTEGRFWVPLWNGNAFRASASLLVSKATAGSLSMFGLSATAAGADPGAGADWIGAAYVQGTGIVVRRKAAPGGDAMLIPDASLVDGQRYTVGLVFDGVLHAAGSPGEFVVQATISNADGSILASAPFFSVSAYYPATGAFVTRTSVANGVDNLQMTPFLGGDVGAQTAVVSGAYAPGFPSERMTLRVPARPNGKLVMVIHGRGDNVYTQFSAAQYDATWRLLLANGYTLAMPNMGGDLWGTAAAQQFLATNRNAVCDALNLDRQVMIWAGSMGGGAALTAIARKTFGTEGVTAAYLAQPVCDVAAVYADNSATFTEIPGLYPNDAAYAAYSPIRQDPAAFAGVPLLFLASPADTVVSKTKNTDAMRARIGAATRHNLIVTVGNHGDQSEFQAAACLSWFQSV